MAVAAYPRPNLTEQDASDLAGRLFHIDIEEIEPLPSERDQNFYIKDSSGKEFVLKIAGPAEKRETLEMQNRAMTFLSDRIEGGLFSRVCNTDSNEQITTITSNSGLQFSVRLLTYLPGKLFAKVKPHSPELLRSLGEMLGKVDSGLANFSHAAAHRELKWDLKTATWIREYTNHIANPERRSIVERWVKRFDEKIAPILPSLRTSIIHNDANDYNVLVQIDESGRMRVSGLIDFGDMVHSYTIGELAVALAYSILDKPDPLSAAWHVVSGYNSVYPLTELEIEVLFDLVCTRLCVSVTNSAREQKREPDNAYLTISEEPAWALLKKLAVIDPALAHYTFRDACGLPACPTSPAIVAWLRNNQDQIGPVIDAGLKSWCNLVFDLSVGSPEIKNPLEMADVPSITRRMVERMQAMNTNVGIGKYNEARSLYISDIFKVEGNDGPRARTVHIGIDLFQEAMSPVFAPLDGKIHSFTNNKEALDYGPTIIVEHEFDDIKFFTLYGHLSDNSLEGLYTGKPVSKGDRIARIGSYPTNGGWPPHLHFQIIADMLGKEGEFQGVAFPDQRNIWLSICPDPNLILGIRKESLLSDTLTESEILDIRHEHVGPSLSISYKSPLKIVRGWMQYLYDDNGRAYLDAVNNVPHVGHSHPKVVRAAYQQMAVLNTNTRYLHDNLAKYAQRLTSTLPEPLNVCFFVCSGSEANELALRLARAHTKRKALVVVDGGYHGNTTTLVEISPYKFDGPGGSGPPDYVHKVMMPDPYRRPHRASDNGAAYARYVRDAIEDAESRDRKIGAFICESLLSCGGQIVLPDNYLKTAYEHIRSAGGVCIADEVQIGFGRVGSHFWGFETQNVVPDIVTMGKPIGNGHPLAAVVTTPEIAASFDNGMEYFNTFGGNPVSCAVGLAVLDVIQEERLQDNALAVGHRLIAGLKRLMTKYKLIGDVRGLGLFVGIELIVDREVLSPAAKQASYIVERMKDRGILVSTDGPLHNVIKIKPPLVFSSENADYFVETLDEILSEDFLKM